MPSSQRYVLGLDIGSASVGWACIATDTKGSPNALLRAGVRIFEPGVDGSSLEIQRGKDQSKAVDRRAARLQRRQLRRRVARQRDLFRVLQLNDLLPASEGAGSEQRHEVLNSLDREISRKFGAAAGQLPMYLLRKHALYERLDPHELGRVFFHLSQRRGFLSNRKDVKKSVKENEDLGQVKEAIRTLEAEIEAAGAQTLGEYLAGLDPHRQQVRRRWTARKMYVEEFGKIWAAQQPHHPDLLIPELQERIAYLLFFQRKIAKQSHLIGKCELEPGQRRAPWATLPAQRFRVLQKVNDLRIEQRDGNGQALSQEQRYRLTDLLNREGTQTFAKIKAHLNLSKITRFNLERGDEKSMPGNRTEASMRAAFGVRWDQFSEGKQNNIVENWRNSTTDQALLAEAGFLGLDDEHAKRLMDERPAAEYCALSLAAIQKLMPLMLAGKPFKEAEKEVYGTRFSGEPIHDILPTVRGYLTSLRNPAVERALTEVRKVVNALVREYGKPSEIRIELARELKKPRAERAKTTTNNRKREADNKALAKRMADECGLQRSSARDLEKAKLWVEGQGECPYTGQRVAFSRLFDDDCGLDVDHILPRSRYPDDSFQNKVLCSLTENREYKRNQTPYEAYGHDEHRWALILARTAKWNNPHKVVRFKISSEEALGEFSARQLNDTRYSSLLAARLLGTLYGGRDVQEGEGTRQVIFASSGAVTATLRRTWGFEQILQGLVHPEPNETRGKPRTDHRHHAIDAIVIALTRSSVIQEMARASSLQPWQPGTRGWRNVPQPWTASNFFASVQQHIAEMVVSHRPEHKVSGELHKGSNYGRPFLQDGKSTVHSRVALSSLSATDIDDDEIIVDKAVREAVRAKLQEIGGDPKLFALSENAPVLPAGEGRIVPIRKVRIQEIKNPMKVGQGVRERWVASGGIHHVELFVERGGKRKENWLSCVVQRPEAYERLRRKLPVVARSIEGKDAEFLFSISKDDTVEVTQKDRTQLLRVKKFGDNGQIWFVPINDAHDDAAQSKLAITWSKTPSTLKQLKPRKVVVDLLGRVHPAND